MLADERNERSSPWMCQPPRTWEWVWNMQAFTAVIMGMHYAYTYINTVKPTFAILFSSFAISATREGHISMLSRLLWTFKVCWEEGVFNIWQCYQCYQYHADENAWQIKQQICINSTSSEDARKRVLTSHGRRSIPGIGSEKTVPNRMFSKASNVPQTEEKDQLSWSPMDA